MGYTYRVVHSLVVYCLSVCSVVQPARQGDSSLQREGKMQLQYKQTSTSGYHFTKHLRIYAFENTLF